jgi:hypothetical protein
MRARVGNASLISHDHGRGFPLPEFDEGKIRAARSREGTGQSLSETIIFRADSTDSTRWIAKSPIAVAGASEILHALVE